MFNCGQFCPPNLSLLVVSCSSMCTCRFLTPHVSENMTAKSFVDSWMYLFFFPHKAIQLFVPTSSPVCQPLPKCEGHLLAHGNYLGRSEPSVHVPAKHARFNGNEGLAMGFLHQSQCSWLPNQVYYQPFWGVCVSTGNFLLVYCLISTRVLLSCIPTS